MMRLDNAQIDVDINTMNQRISHREGSNRLLPIVGIIAYRDNPKSEKVIGLNLASDIYLAGHNFGDEGLTVFF